MNHRPALFLALLLAACRSTEPSAGTLELVDRLSADGRYAEALIAAESWRQRHPGDPEGERQFRRAQAAVMLDEARRECFREENEAALARVGQAQALAPDERVLADWKLKLERKLAEIHVGRGDEFFASTDLEAARDEYEKALHYVPDDPTAKLGLTQVLVQINYRQSKGEGYYEEGVHLLRDYWLEQSRTRFSYTEKYQPKNERAKDRKQQVSSQLAGSRSALAADLERRGLWSAARNEYRIALLIDEKHPEAIAGRARTEIEARAEEKLREAERMTRAKQYDKARAAVAEGLALTQHQRDRFEGALAGIEEALLEDEYKSAIAMESDQDFPAAIAAYDRLLQKRDFFKDALTRRDTLAEFVERAGPLYQKALEATSPEEKLGYLKQIAVFWPEYENVLELIRMLEPAQAPGGETKP